MSGLRDIDGNAFNKASTEVAELARKARWLIEEVVTRGLEVTLFGIPLKIKLGTEAK